jgi:ABC-type Fe3+/spermidine/putrescine transport system ATPase subunit
MTLRLIAGLDQVENAVLHFDGHDLSTRPAELRGVGYVPQNYGLFPHLTVARQIVFSPDADPKLAAHWMARLGLTGLEARHPNELSLGQQQRVALARALARRADLLLLDEPFSALDAPLRARLRREFASLQQEFEATTILVTHDPTEAIALADEFLVLNAGRVLQTGPLEEVFMRPANEVVARMLGAENVGFGRAVASDLIEVGDGIRLTVAGPALQHPNRIGWSVRADRIRFADDGRHKVSILHVSDIRGGRRIVTIRLGNAQFDVPVDPSLEPTHMAARVDIDPKALQIWTLGS